MNFVRIEGFPNYVIHPAGTILRIWKHKTRKRGPCTKEMKTRKNKDGYIMLGLNNNGKQKTLKLHRLLAIAFIPNDDPEKKIEIDHINGVRDDNRLENLRWVTHQENLNAFRSDRGVFNDITKGYIYKRNNSWIWQYNMSGKQKSKSMKNLKDLEQYKLETLAKYY